MLELENTRNFIKNKTPTEVFSCEYYKIFKNTYFEERLRRAGSAYYSHNGFILAR